MPELPEVETIKRWLEKKIIGKHIDSIEILEKKQFIGDKNQIIGSTIIGFYRKGKYLSIQLSNGLFLCVHLKMSGQLIFVDDKNHPVIKNELPKLHTNRLPAKFTRIIIYFADNSALFFNDMRKFGWIKIAKLPDGPESIDVASPQFTFENFQQIITSSTQAIKPFLLDQNQLAGLGNIYVNDALWQAKIHPFRQVNSLTPDEQYCLFESIHQTIQEGITQLGSSSQDENFILPDGTRGNYQNHFKVYHREDQPCFRCKTLIKRVKQAGRSSFYCVYCQK